MQAAAVRLPAEWEALAAMQLTWPHPAGDWGAQLGAAEETMLELARQLSRQLPLLIACHDQSCLHRLNRTLRHNGLHNHQYALYPMPSNDIWSRDHGPLTVYRNNGHPELLNFVFNGWGGRFPAAWDNALNARLHAAGAYGAVPIHSIDLELEGGAIDSDGAGTLLTTTGAMLRSRRGGGARRHRDRCLVERQLRSLFGCERILWLEHNGLRDDDTGGHVDLLARFTDPGTIVYASGGRRHPEYAALAALAAELAPLRRADGSHYELVPLPMPRSAQTRPCSYTNFLIANDLVLVPQYADRAADQAALELLAQCFPRRQCLGIDCRALIRQGGALHCAAMQLPHGIHINTGINREAGL